MKKKRAPRNRTLTCTPAEIETLRSQLLTLDTPQSLSVIQNRIIHQDSFAALPLLPRAFADLIILDPPYNLSKDYNGHLFKEKESDAYQRWFTAVLEQVAPCAKPDATIYVCADWKTSLLIAPLLDQFFHIQNRITWEREKGRGAKTNWKNNSEDIWFCTMSPEYSFNVDAVKLKRRVLAPYRTQDGQPKDWEEGEKGNYRLTHPSNLWTDITVPFWSMPENTDHPTQKPEKLIAKLILASSHAGDIILDPFLGSGTTAVVAQKLGRHFVGIEQNETYGCWGLKRLQLAQTNSRIQGYAQEVFWERNTLNEQSNATALIKLNTDAKRTDHLCEAHSSTSRLSNR